MEHFAKAFWEKAKVAGEFVGGIVAIGALLYGLSWAADDIFAHVQIHADHHWWAYRVWDAWWPVIVPLAMVGIGWPFRRRALGGGLWAAGAVWIAFMGWAVGMMLFLGMFSRVSGRVGLLWGTVLSCAGVLTLGLGSVAVGRLVTQIRSRLSR
jgi:hypothetical protein